jgi:hypothetical protein
MCCSEKVSARINESVIITCSYDLEVFNKSNEPIQTMSLVIYTRDSIHIYVIKPHCGPGVDSASNRNEYQKSSRG